MLPKTLPIEGEASTSSSMLQGQARSLTGRKLFFGDSRVSRDLSLLQTPSSFHELIPHVHDKCSLI